jgi:hypothetical protein
MSDAVERDMAERDESLRQQFQRDEQRLIQQQEQRLQGGKTRRAAEHHARTARNKELAGRALAKVCEALGRQRLEELHQEAKQKSGRHASPSRAKRDRFNEEAVVAVVDLVRFRHPELSVRKACDKAFELYQRQNTFGLPNTPDSLRTTYLRAKKKTNNPEN